MNQGNYGDKPPSRIPPPNRLKQGNPGNEPFAEQQQLSLMHFEFEVFYSNPPDSAEVNINVFLATPGYKIVSHAVEPLMEDGLSLPDGNIFVRLDIEDDPTAMGFHYDGQINNVTNPVFGSMVPWRAIWGSIADHVQIQKIYGKLLSVPN